jgi:hypothetical protein
VFGTTDQHFTSWLMLAPQNKTSGARLLSGRTQRRRLASAGGQLGLGLVDLTPGEVAEETVS